MVPKGGAEAMQSPHAVDPLKIRMTGLMLLCMGFAGAVAVRAAMVQVFKDPRLEQLARRQFQSKVLIRPRRGAITDRNGDPLAINAETRSLAANPSKLENPRALARLLSKATDIPYKKLAQRLAGGKEFVWIKRHLSEPEMHRLRKWHILGADGELAPGLLMIKESKRAYPHGELAAHLLGDVNIDLEGLEGVELWRNEKMTGKVLSVNAIKDAMGRPAFIDAVSAKSVQDHKDGEPVALTIDASLQFAVEQELKTTVTKSGARGGTVIVMNAVNGEVLALANQPSFNPNDLNVPAERRRNRALTDGYEPGSTLKAVLVASALTHGWRLTDRVWGEQGKPFLVQGKPIREAEAREKFEWLSLDRLIQVSSNVGAAKVALKLGAENYQGTLRALGFGSRTGSGFPGEISGALPARDAWQPLTLANVGFGQGILVTPMQMTRAYAAFLNGGMLVQPQLIKDSSIKPEPPRRVLPQQVADLMLKNLQGPLRDDGTGVKANLPGYVVAGKTGTAQKVEPGARGYSRTKYVASFIGMPLGVEPKVVIFAAVDEPKGNYYASETAAPLFKAVLGAVANRFSLPTRPDAPSPVLAGVQRMEPAGPKLSASARLVSALKAGNGIGSSADWLRTSQAHPAPAEPPAELHWQGTSLAGHPIWTMPSLKGLTPREALRALQGHRFHVEIRGSGVIRSQYPEEGKPLNEGETVKLSLGEL